MGSWLKIDLNTEPGHFVCLALYENVSNANELLSMLRRDELEAALLNPRMILSELQLAVAGAYALDKFLTQTMKTNNVHSELVFGLLVGTNVYFLRYYLLTVVRLWTLIERLVFPRLPPKLFLLCLTHLKRR